MRPPIYLLDPDLSDLKISPSIVILLLFLLGIGLAFFPILLAVGIVVEIAILINPKLKTRLEQNGNQQSNKKETERFRSK